MGWGPGRRQGPGREAAAGEGWARRARDLPSALRPPGLPLWAWWTHSSRSHQPDSPRGRLRRQTAMHRAPRPAPAPQPACAIARPPARGLPRAISRFQGRRTSLCSRRASTGPRNPCGKYRARSTPPSFAAAPVPLIPVPGPLEPRRPGSEPTEPHGAPPRTPPAQLTQVCEAERPGRA